MVASSFLCCEYSLPLSGVINCATSGGLFNVSFGAFACCPLRHPFHYRDLCFQSAIRSRRVLSDEVALSRAASCGTCNYSRRNSRQSIDLLFRHTRRRRLEDGGWRPELATDLRQSPCPLDWRPRPGSFESECHLRRHWRSVGGRRCLQINRCGRDLEEHRLTRRSSHLVAD